MRLRRTWILHSPRSAPAHACFLPRSDTRSGLTQWRPWIYDTAVSLLGVVLISAACLKSSSLLEGRENGLCPACSVVIGTWSHRLLSSFLVAGCFLALQKLQLEGLHLPLLPRYWPPQLLNCSPIRSIVAVLGRQNFHLVRRPFLMRAPFFFFVSGAVPARQPSLALRYPGDFDMRSHSPPLCSLLLRYGSLAPTPAAAMTPITSSQSSQMNG